MHTLTKKLLLLLTLIALAYPIITYAQTTHQEIVADQSNKADLNVYQYVQEVARGAASSLGDQIVPSRLADGSTNNYGAVPSLNSGIVFLATRPPVHTAEYVADLLQNSGFIQPAYAQGLGFSSLSPVLTVWKAFRNIAYFLFILIFIAIGFMIMFRAQIDHQTVVTVQMALPKLIITLILITFSYAIAGLVVDLLYLLIFLIIALFAQFGIISNPATMQNAILGRSILGIAWNYLIAPADLAGNGANAVSAIITGMIRIPILDFLADWLIDSIAYLIIAVAILIAVFRTFFTLLMAYVGIIIATIFAPIQLMLNAIPGQNTFGTWLKGIVANALIFPAITVMLILGIYLAGGNNDDSGITSDGRGTWGGNNGGFGRAEGTGFVPPFITSRAQSDFTTGENGSNFGVEQIRALIGLGFVMLLPEVAKIVKKAMGVEDSGMFDAVGAGFKAGAAPIGAPFRAAGGLVTGLGKSAFMSGAYSGIAGALDPNQPGGKKGFLGTIGAGVSSGFSALKPSNILSVGTSSNRIQSLEEERLQHEVGKIREEKLLKAQEAMNKKLEGTVDDAAEAAENARRTTAQTNQAAMGLGRNQKMGS
jgi:hypothetical protein